MLTDKYQIPKKCIECDMPNRYRPKYPGDCVVCYTNKNLDEISKSNKEDKIYNLIIDYIQRHFKYPSSDNPVKQVDNSIRGLKLLTKKIISLFENKKKDDIYDDLAEMYQEINDIKEEMIIDKDCGEL